MSDKKFANCVECGIALSEEDSIKFQGRYTCKECIESGNTNSSIDTVKNTKALQIWGWVLATIGSFILPLLALGAIAIGVVIIIRGKVSQGIGMIVISIVVAIFAMSFWEAFFWALSW